MKQMGISVDKDFDNLSNTITNGERLFALPVRENNAETSGSLDQVRWLRNFDSVVFSDEVGKVHGPVHTQFGYHLLEITSRNP